MADPSRGGQSGSGGNGCDSSCASTRSRSSEPRPEGNQRSGPDTKLARIEHVTNNPLGRSPPEESAANTLAALKYIRAARPDGAPIYIILDNVSVHRGTAIRAWAARTKVELCCTPTYTSWANPIEAPFGPLRTFVIAGSNYPNHTFATRALHDHLRWRNAYARHPDILAAQRRERARTRGERHQRRGHPRAA